MTKFCTHWTNPIQNLTSRFILQTNLGNHISDLSYLDHQYYLKIIRMRLNSDDVTADLSSWIFMWGWGGGHLKRDLQGHTIKFEIFHFLATLRYDKCTGGWPLYWTQNNYCNICEIYLTNSIGTFSHPSLIFKHSFSKQYLDAIGPFSYASSHIIALTVVQ